MRNGVLFAFRLILFLARLALSQFYDVSVLCSGDMPGPPKESKQKVQPTRSAVAAAKPTGAQTQAGASSRSIKTPQGPRQGDQNGPY